MPRVLIDLRMVRGRLHGVARYALELARRLPGLAPDIDFLGLTGPDGLPEDLGPLTPELPLVATSGEFLSLREQPGLMASLLKISPDLFHATSFSLPALWTGPLVATLHDANHLALAGQYGPGRVTYYRLVVRPRAMRAKALLTVSEFSKEELSIHLRIPKERFKVVSNGVDPRFKPHPPQSEPVRTFRQKHRLPDSYFLVVGNDKAFKNVGLISKLAADLPLPLVLAAGTGITRHYTFPSSTVELPPVAEDELPFLYSAAKALLFPSYYEGFGLPAVEAMACGCPVLASDAGALPEVLGNAGVLLPPNDSAAWLAAARLLVHEPHTATILSAKGVARAADFNWDVCSQKTLDVYRQALWTRRAKSA